MSKAYPIKNQLRKFRRASGLTQKEVARLLDLSSTAQISRWERGERVPKLAHALRLSVLYNRMVNDLFFELFDDQRKHFLEKRSATRYK
jgi:transcriptional regulator with XRE-family HTH domain